LTSSRETPDLVEFYRHGVNAYVVKPVEFSEFVEAVKQVGVFWAVVNEAAPMTGREGRRGEAADKFLIENKRSANEISPAHSAP
jgi:hypothetical protein